MIFSERLETLRFLEEHLQAELDLPEGAIQKLHGGLSDVEQQAEANIDDPASLMGVYDIDEEQKITADAIESGQSAEDFGEDLEEDETDVMELLLGGEDEEEEPDTRADVVNPVSLYDSEFEYLGAALRHLNDHKGAGLDVDLYDEDETVRLTASEEIKERFRRLPNEAWPTDSVFFLSADPGEVQQSIADARKEEHAWPRVQYLWRQHPLSQWASDKVVANFRRSEAPVLTLSTLGAGETIVVCSGNVPNRKGQPVVNDWVGVQFWKDLGPEILTFEEVLEETDLGARQLSNPAPDVDLGALRDLVPTAVETASEWMEMRRNEKNDRLNEKLNARLQELEALQDEHERHLERKYADSDRPAAIVEPEKQKERREIERISEDFFEWAEDTMTIEEEAYIQVIAVLTGLR